MITRAIAALPELREPLERTLATAQGDSSDAELWIAAYAVYGGVVWNFLRDGWAAGRTDDVRRVLVLAEQIASSGDPTARSVITTEIAYQAVTHDLHVRMRELMGPATQTLLDSQKALVNSNVDRKKRPR